MQCYWEQIGVLGPTYRLLGLDRTNHEIAVELGRTEEVIENCITWMLHSLQLDSRSELVLRSFEQNELLGI